MNETPRQRQVRLAEERAAEAEAKEQAAAERQALLERDDVKAAISSARLAQTRAQYVQGKPRSLVLKCEQAVEAAQQGRFSDHAKLLAEINETLRATLNPEARFKELQDAIETTNAALMQLGGPPSPQPEAKPKPAAGDPLGLYTAPTS